LKALSFSLSRRADELNLDLAAPLAPAFCCRRRLVADDVTRVDVAGDIGDRLLLSSRTFSA
jgi:hypothetical protein